ncbi:hypothetical protein N9W84_00200 [bacterium]|nr:hypothetical protein [bacterium]
MNHKKLSKRLKYIEATPLKDRATVKKMTRRDLNNISDYETQHPNDGFDDFFKFEDDLADLKSSREQFAMMEDFSENEESSSPTVLEQNLFDSNPKDSFVIMENQSKVTQNAEVFIDSKIIEEPKIIEDQNKEIKLRCIYLLKNGNRCKFNRVSDSIYCGIHKKITNKQVDLEK